MRQRMDETEFKKSCIKGYIERLMKANGQTQTMMAMSLGMSQPTFSEKLSEMKFTVGELIKICKFLGASEVEIGRLIAG